MIVDPKEIATRDLHQFLLASVAPRPIAFVSTIDSEGRNNLAPYSFFNAFSSNPPIVVFSSNRRVADNTTKDTLQNVIDSKECVINVVSYNIVRQMAVTSIQFETGISEFEKAGLTPVASDIVKAPRVKESPVNMECVVKEVQTLGDQGGAGHLIICEVVRMHIDDNVIGDNNRIDPHKIDLMGRMGRAYYVRASGEAIHTIVQAVTEISIGYDQIPESIKQSTVLSANNLGSIAGIKAIPSKETIQSLLTTHPAVQSILEGDNIQHHLHSLAKNYLEEENKLEMAANILWLSDDYA
ncbi:MAG: flavin reductase family protein [Bacteroidota bacterium]